MRLLHVVSSPGFAGVERYISYVAPLLAARGCEVTVAGGNRAAMTALLGSSDVRFLPADNVVEASVQVARCRGFDLVHAHMTAADWAVFVTKPFSPAAAVSTRHFAAHRGRTPAVRRLSRLVPSAFDLQIAISAFVASAIGEPSVILPNGVPRCDTTAQRRPVVLVLQRLEAEKHTSVALEAWEQSRARRLGWRMLIAGEGTLGADLRGQSSTLGLSGSVEFTGHRSDVPELLQSAGILLATAPSEPFGLSVVEAMATGLPVVAAAGGGHLETVGSCTTEYLYPPGDPAACADRLDALVDDEPRRLRYATALQTHQREHFDLGTHVDRLLELYEGVLQKRATRAGAASTDSWG